MPRDRVLSRQLLIMLSVWLLVWGMTAVDLFDLTDDILQPFACPAQAVESEIDEFDDPGVPHTAVSLAWAQSPFVADGERFDPYRLVAYAPSRLLYQRLAQYRI